jgi:hypothetical protein
METTKKGKSMNKALMMGTALISLSSLAVAEAQAASLTTAPISAEVLTPIGITAPTALDFGQVTIASAAAGTLPVDFAGARGAATGSMSPVTSSTVSQGVVSITSAGGVALRINMGATTYNVTNTTDAGETMAVNTFTLRQGTAGVTATGTANLDIATPATTETINIGGTLNTTGFALGAGDGVYQGTFTISAIYQ